MIRKEEDYSNMKITVYLLNGTVFKDCDVTQNPFGEYERLVSFYHNDKIYAYPMSQVGHVEISF